MLQLSFKSRTVQSSNGAPRVSALRPLAELAAGEHGIVERIEMPEEDARRLMELGFLPGHSIVPARSAPGGDPRVFRVDGSEVALRRETAGRVLVRCTGSTS